MDKRITLHIEGMTCSNCALTIGKILEKEGMKEVSVNFIAKEASAEVPDPKNLNRAVEIINSIGYRVSEMQETGHEHGHTHQGKEVSFFTTEKKFYFCLAFTLPLFLHMLLPFHLLHLPLVQLALCIPVMAAGIQHFGRSAWGSVRSGVPNMDVLITIGSSAAFLYSLAGTAIFYNSPEVSRYLFYETAATIITLVLLGNLLEQRSVKQTTGAIRELAKIQATKAKKLKAGTENEFTEVVYADIVKGDILLAGTGDKVPVDGTILWGDALIDESMISGESVPVEKKEGDTVIGGTLLVKGSLRMKAEKVGSETVLSRIIEMVKNAQNSQPAIQRLGDKVSAVFVPVVVGVSILTFILSFFLFELPAQKALLSAVAVLVISCPCAMGLATPTAVMVGIGRAARSGILIRGGSTLETFSKIQTIVFDKTGTLTTGNFRIRNILPGPGMSKEMVMSVLYHMEIHSSHPIAKSIVKESGQYAAGIPLRLISVKEDKGMGMLAVDHENNQYRLGSFNMVKEYTNDPSHSVYLVRNGQMAATLDLEDELKPNVKEVIQYLKKKSVRTVLLSGDSQKKCEAIAKETGIDEVYGGRMPHEKLEIIEKLGASSLVAMVGDGINDAPALAKAAVGVSLSNASQTAIQSAQVILLQGNLEYLVNAMRISTHTMRTIRQNLFWAFFYNAAAIPVAAAGLLSPMIAALAMAFSDVIVVGNSIRLKTKKIS